MIKLIVLFTVLFSGFTFANEKTIVFVGEQISYEGKSFEDQQELICPDAKDDEVCVTMDSMFLAKYKVKKVISGKIKDKVLEFYQFDHYGLPDYFKYKYALVVADVTDRGVFGHKYTSIPVYEAGKGKYYYCPSPKESFAFEDQAKRVKFNPAVSIDTSHLSSQGIKDIESSKFYEYKDGKLNCVMGVSLKNAADYILE